MEVRQEDIDAFIAWLKTKGFDAIAKSSVELSPMSLQAFKDARPLQRTDIEQLGGVPSAYMWGDLYVRDFKDDRTTACAQAPEGDLVGVEAPRRARAGGAEGGLQGVLWICGGARRRKLKRIP
jgi:hypothetical protein